MALHRKAYSEGFTDGVETAILLLEGKESYGGIPYKGPIPEELKIWIEEVKVRLAQNKKESN